MRYLPITLNSPAANLALDELLMGGVLIKGFSSAKDDMGALRVWESPTPLVVLGRASRIEEEVDLMACEQRGAAVLRRASGGATIVCGPGCLMYAVTLPLTGESPLEQVEACHDAVLGPVAESLAWLVPTVHRAGTSDLAFRPQPGGPALKFSGNSLRVIRGRLLYHGTLLYGFDLTLVSELLRTPPRQPEYRAARPHAEFVGNLPVDRAALIDAVVSAWPITETIESLPPTIETAVADRVVDRYGLESWTRAR